MLVLYDPFRINIFDELLDAVSSRACRFSAQELMRILAYDDAKQFGVVIEAARRACWAQRIPIHYHFRTIFISDHGSVYQEYRLSGLACHLIIMNADPVYPAVAQAQLRLARRASEL